MPNISTGINLDSNFLNLKAIEIKEVATKSWKFISRWGENNVCF